MNASTAFANGDNAHYNVREIPGANGNRKELSEVIRGSTLFAWVRYSGDYHILCDHLRRIVYERNTHAHQIHTRDWHELSRRFTLRERRIVPALGQV